MTDPVFLSRFFRRIRLAWLLAMSWAALGVPAAAQQVFAFAETRALVSGSGHSGQGAQIAFDWEAEVKIGHFLGEPVVSTRFRWDLDGGTVTLPSATTRGSPYETHLLATLPAAARATLRLYDVRLKVEFSTPSGDVYLMSDVGLPGKPGEWSFNLPGSPEWAALLIRAGSPAERPDYVDAATAKRLVKRGLSASGASILSAGLSMFDLHAWYERENPDHYLAVYDAALDHLEKGILISYGLPSQDGRDASQHRTLNQRVAALAFYRRLYEKYLDPPEFVTIGDNHTPYRVARSEAMELVRRARATRPAFDSDQEQLPGGRAPGRPGEFRAPQRYAIVDGWLIDTTTGAQLSEVWDGDRILFDEFMVLGLGTHCSNHVVERPLSFYPVASFRRYDIDVANRVKRLPDRCRPRSGQGRLYTHAIRVEAISDDLAEITIDLHDRGSEDETVCRSGRAADLVVVTFRLTRDLRIADGYHYGKRRGRITGLKDC